MTNCMLYMHVLAQAQGTGAECKAWASMASAPVTRLARVGLPAGASAPTRAAPAPPTPTVSRQAGPGLVVQAVQQVS